MDCAPVDILFAVLMVVFVVLAGVTNYRLYCLIQQIKQSSPRIWVLLGRPLVSDATDSLGWDFFRFIWSPIHKKLGNADLSRSALVWRWLFVSCIVLLMVLIGVACASQSLEATVTLRCFFNRPLI